MNPSTRVQVVPRSSTVPIRPNLSTFIDLARHAAFHENQSAALAPHAREAQSVASSVTIGRGFSYTITRKDIMPCRNDALPPVHQRGVTVSTTTPPAAQQSKIARVIYKIPNVDFYETGEATPESNGAYASILRDFLVLSHESTILHENLLTLVGLAWGNMPGERPYMIPVPIVQYADFGCLADLQESKQLCNSHKLRLLMDMATGLEFLHRCDIVHGDFKSENVLIFAHTDFRYCAKLTDFGSALPGGQGVFDVYNKGTELWAAPEILEGNSDTACLPAGDVFSFGLTVWRTAIDGFDPLSTFMLSTDDVATGGPSIRTLNKRPCVDAAVKLSADKRLTELASSAIWIPKLELLRTFGTRASCGCEQALHLGNVQNQDTVTEEAYFACLDRILGQTLHPCPSERSIESAKVDLETLYGRDPKSSPKTRAQSITSTRSYEILKSGGFVMSYIAMRDIQPHIMNVVFGQIVRLNDVTRRRNGWTPRLESLLTAGFMSGMGSDRFFDAREAVRACDRGAKAGTTGLRAIIYRLVNVADGNCGGDILSLLRWSAERGSMAAMEDLRDLDPEMAESAAAFLRRHTCGIGADFFTKIIGPFSYPQLSDRSIIEAHLRRTGQKASEIIVNTRGDTLIHAAASGGSADVVELLLDVYDVPVNLRNPHGETPLLCAMRSGHVDIVNYLLDRAADAKIRSTRQESVLHWLISIPDSALYDLLARLIANGAEIQEPRWALSCDYAATMITNRFDRWDSPGAGSPLHWATSRKRAVLVKLLLDQGAKHNDRGSIGTNHTPFEQAAYFHDHEILRIYIDTKYPRPRVPCFDTGHDSVIHKQSDEIPGGSLLIGLSALIREAINGSDRFLMAVRWGTRYKVQLHETLKLLGEELSYQQLINGVDKAGRSPLQYAAYRGFHEAAEHIYEFMEGTSMINTPYERGGGITPIFEAIRRGNKTLFNFLLDKGARVDIKIDSPSMRGRFDWCILHAVAQHCHFSGLELANRLLELGLPPDGYEAVCGQEPTETPLAVAIDSNNFKLADLLRQRGANINTLSRFTLSSHMTLQHPMTILGRIIASNLRDWRSRIKYLLNPETEMGGLPKPDFLVAPSQGWTALHVSALGLQARDPEFRQDLDAEVSKNILKYLLEFYDKPHQVNALTTDAARTTALHIAVQTHNLEAVVSLLNTGVVDLHIRAHNGCSVIETATICVEEAAGQDQQEYSSSAEDILAALFDYEDQQH